MTNTEWAKCVIVLRAIYTHTFKLDADAISVWFDLLEDLPGERVINAIRHMAKTQPAFPSVADIRKLAEPTPADVGEAWRQACEYVGLLSLGPRWHDGQPQPLPALEPWIQGALEAVGADAIRNRTSETEGTLRAHFMRFYEARLKREQMAASGLLSDPTPSAMRIGALLPEVLK